MFLCLLVVVVPLSWSLSFQICGCGGGGGRGEEGWEWVEEGWNNRIKGWFKYFGYLNYLGSQIIEMIKSTLGLSSSRGFHTI